MLKKIVTHLTFYVLLAIVAGILLGHYDPETALKTEPLGTYFIALIKLFIAPIIFLTIVLGIGSMGDLKKVGKIGFKALVYFEIVTTISLVIGVVIALVFQPGNIDKSGLPIQDASKYTSGPQQAFSWWNFFATNTTIQVLIAAIVFGMVLSNSKYRSPIVERLETLSHWVFTALKYVMYLAPIGAFGGMAFTIGKYGLAALLPLGKLMLCVYMTMFLFIIFVLGAVLRYYQVSIWKFLRYLRDELLIVLGTSSSEAALPALMSKLEAMGCNRSVVGLVVPTGYSFNLDGTSIYLSMAIVFLAQVFNVQLSWEQIITIIGVLMVTSKGAAGVTGSGFIILASTLAAVKVIPVQGLALLLGVDRFMSEARAITNFIGNGVATVFLSNHESLFDRSKMEERFNERLP